MRSSFSAIMLVFAALVAGSVHGEGQIRTRMEIADLRVEAYYEDLGIYFGASYREVARLHRRGIHLDEIPVILFLANRSGVATSDLVRMRLRGGSWMEISRRCGVRAEAYGVFASRKTGPHHGNAYGRGKKHGATVRRDMWLSDGEIISAVHMMFLTGMYRCNERHVDRLRARGLDVIAMVHEFGREFRSSVDDRRSHREDDDSTDDWYR